MTATDETAVIDCGDQVEDLVGSILTAKDSRGRDVEGTALRVALDGPGAMVELAVRRELARPWLCADALYCPHSLGTAHYHTWEFENVWVEARTITRLGQRPCEVTI